MSWDSQFQHLSAFGCLCPNAYTERKGKRLSRLVGTHGAAALAPGASAVSFLAAVLLVPEISALLLNIDLFKGKKLPSFPDQSP